MNVVLTNDDGWDSVGIGVLYRTLCSAGHAVTMMAPDRPRSACSHGITPFKPISLTRRSSHRLVCSGTPADCIFLALGGQFPMPDVVLSGINHGANLGRDIIYSGTVAAARQAVLMGTPGIAVSLVIDGAPEVDADRFKPIADVVVAELESLRAAWRPNHLININAPYKITGGIRLTTLSERKYSEKCLSFSAPKSATTYYLMNGRPTADQDSGTDVRAVHDGYISLSAIEVYHHTTTNDRYHDICSRHP